MGGNLDLIDSGTLYRLRNLISSVKQHHDKLLNCLKGEYAFRIQLVLKLYTRNLIDFMNCR